MASRDPRPERVTTTAAVILTGGSSRRMGHPKELLDVAGKPLLVHVLERVGAVCPCVVVARPGQPLPPLPPAARRVDDSPGLAGQGPLVGLLAGLEAVSGSADLVYCGSVDAPLVTAAHVRFVLSRLAADATAAALVPLAGETPDDPCPQPLAAAVRVEPALAAARELVARGERRLVALLAALPTREVPGSDLPDPAVLATCNTPEEWQEARRRLGRG